jgi:hypothetical protein
LAACAPNCCRRIFPRACPATAPRPVTVASRERPDFDPLGTRIDSFVLHPQLVEGLGYDNNVFGGTNRVGSWILGTHPSLLVNSDWSRDSLGGYLGADDLRYLDQPRQSRTDWAASVGRTLAVGRDQLSLAVARLALHQDRTQLDALPMDTPVAYQVNDVRVGYTFALNRISIEPALAFSTFRYDTTTILDVPTPQAYRNRDVAQASVTTRYEMAPQRNLLVI